MATDTELRPGHLGPAPRKLRTIPHPQCVIVDIDGTLADGSHRQHLVQGKRKDYDAFYDLCHLDAPHTHIGVTVNLLQPTYAAVLVTGRIERVREKTVDWLARHFISYTALFMRPDGDTRQDDVLKEEILDRDILPRWTPAFALDDRNRVVAMWRRRGIPCLQVAEGDF